MRPAGLIHHLEHDLHSLALLAENLGVAVAIVAETERAGRARANAHLVFNTGGLYVVSSAEGAIFIRYELGHDRLQCARAPDSRCSQRYHFRRW